MTIRHPAFWLYLLSLLALGLGIIGYILVTQYHPGLELRDAFIVLDVADRAVMINR